MTSSGTIALDHATHAAASASASTRLTDLDERRRAAQRTVEELLASWRGEAASHFDASWRDWDAGARDVIDALAALLGALDLARDDLLGADVGVSDRSEQLAGRLG